MVEELGSTYGLARHGGGGALIAVEVVILEIRILAAGSFFLQGAQKLYPSWVRLHSRLARSALSFTVATSPLFDTRSRSNLCRNQPTGGGVGSFETSISGNLRDCRLSRARRWGRQALKLPCLTFAVALPQGRILYQTSSVALLWCLLNRNLTRLAKDEMAVVLTC